MKRICIALVGDFNEKMYTHHALNNAVEHCRKHLDFLVETQWISSTSLSSAGLDQNKFQGCWIVPGSPYDDDEAVLATIKWARENDFPILASCGGFQYMILECARNVLQNSNAFHQETHPQATAPVISKLSCSLKGRQEEVLITDKSSWLYKVLNREKVTGHFYCSYGFNEMYKNVFDGKLSFTAHSSEGQVRACELKTHRFFNGTLFQLSLDSTVDQPNPLLLNFFRSVAEN